MDNAKAREWRDVLEIHEAAELFPLMSADELKDLGENIKKNGLHEPVVFVWAGVNSRGYRLLLDGRNRLDAMELAGLEVVRDGKLNREVVSSTRTSPTAPTPTSTSSVPTSIAGISPLRKSVAALGKRTLSSRVRSAVTPTTIRSPFSICSSNTAWSMTIAAASD
jgi:hypothetical protein